MGVKISNVNFIVNINFKLELGINKLIILDFIQSASKFIPSYLLQIR